MPTLRDRQRSRDTEDLRTSTHLIRSRIVSLRVVRCRPVFEMAKLNSQNQNPAYSPPSARLLYPSDRRFAGCRLRLLLQVEQRRGAWRTRYNDAASRVSRW